MTTGLLINMMIERGFKTFDGSHINGNINIVFFKLGIKYLWDSVEVRCGDIDFDITHTIDGNKVEKKNMNHYDFARYIVENIKKV